MIKNKKKIILAKRLTAGKIRKDDGFVQELS